MKDTILRYSLYLSALLLIFNYSIAQTGTNDIKDERIIIEKTYQPLLADGHKIEFKGETPAMDSVLATYDYDILDKVVQIPFTPGILKPLALQRQKPIFPQTGFISAGTGTQFSQYLLAESNKSFNKNDLGGIELHRLRMDGKPQNQLINLNDITVYNIYSKNNFINTTTLFGSYNIFHRYGYNPNVTSVDAGLSEIWRSMISMDDRWKGTVSKSKITYSGFANLYDYFDKNGINEISGILNFTGDKTIKKRHHIVIDITADITQYNNNTLNNTFLLPAKVGYEYRIPGFITHLGLNGTLQNSEFFILPDIYSEKNIIREYLITYAGWRDHIEKNDLRSLSDMNPFIEATPDVRYSYVDNSYSGIRGALGKHFMYNLEYDNKLYYTNKRNNYAGMPLFIPSTPKNGDSTSFSVVYDRVSVNSLKGEFSYGDVNTYRLTCTLEYNSYSLNNQLYAWYMPAFVTGIDGIYRFNKKLFCEATLFYLSGVHALTGTINKTTGMYTDVKLKDHFDVNLKVHYTIDDSWNVFLHLSNITYSTYYRYYNYPSYPVQLLLGALYKF